MSGSAFPALLQLACSINMLGGGGAQTRATKWDQELILIRSVFCLDHASSRKVESFGANLGGVLLHSSEVLGNTSEVGFSLG